MSNWEAYKQTMVEPASLWSAAKENDVAALERLLGEGAELDARDHRGFSPLMLAAYSGHAEAFELLMARRADPNSADNAGNSVLMGAAFKGHLEMVRRLIEAGADVSARNQAGMNAYTFAVSFGRTDVAALIEQHQPITHANR